jgi:predicted dehydrogenase
VDQKLRAAVVGAGFISTKKHIPAFLKHRSRVELAAVADMDEKSARQAAARFGIPRVYTDLSELLERERIDIVDVCTPPRTHAGVALQAIDRGCHVLIEKPMAVSVEECDRIIDASRQQGVRVCVAHSDLFYPPVMRARKLVAEGAIGTFMGMRIFLSTPTGYMTSQQDHWAHKLPGGVIGESGPHVVYLTLAFVNPIREVRVLGSRLTSYPWSRYDDYRIDLVGDGAVSSVTSVYTSDQWAAQVDLWGTKGLLRLDLELMSLMDQRRSDLGHWRVARSGIRESLTLAGGTIRTAAAVASRRYMNTHDILIDRFVRSVSEGLPSPVPPEDGREAVRVMNLIVEQLAQQAPS